MCVWCVRRVHRDIDSPPVPTSPAFPQTIQIVCCPLSPLQTACYEGVLSSKTTKKVINGGKDLRVLNTIMGASTGPPPPPRAHTRTFLHPHSAQT